MKKINIEAGLLFADKGENSKTLYPNNITYSGQPDPSIPKSYSNKYHELYLDIPIKIGYNINRTKISYFLSTGLSPNFYLSTKRIYISSWDNKADVVSKTTGRMGNSLINLAFVASGGIKYNVSKQFVLRIEPTYRQAFTPTVFKTKSKEYYYSFGLNVGLYYTFKSKQ